MSRSSLHTLCHALRRLSAYLGSSHTAAIEAIGPTLLATAAQVLASLSSDVEGSRLAIRQLNEGVLRLNFVWRTEAGLAATVRVLDDTMVLSLRAGVEGVREEIIRCWHTK